MSTPMPTLTPGAARLPDWMPRLSAVMARYRDLPFAWGRADCCLFAADCVQAVTGRDPMADHRGAYASEHDALRALQACGGLVNGAVDRLGPVIRADLAQPGDVGLVLLGGRQSLAVCCGQHFMAPGPHGLVVIHLPDVLRAWRCTAPARVAHG
jgi:hypothetical protein